MVAEASMVVVAEAVVVVEAEAEAEGKAVLMICDNDFEVCGE